MKCFYSIKTKEKHGVDDTEISFWYLDSAFNLRNINIFSSILGNKGWWAIIRRFNFAFFLDNWLVIAIYRASTRSEILWIFPEYARYH